MVSRLAAAGLLAVGVLLMANPLYLPVAVGEPDPAYTHTVQPVQGGSSVADSGVDAEGLSDGDVVDYGDLTPEAREAFDRAREAEGGFGVGEPDARVDSLSYPAEPTLGDGLVIVDYRGERYEFWTRTVAREPGAVVAQRVLLQPVAFLAGFFAVVAAVAVAYRGRLGGTTVT
ncbi:MULTISPECIES: hypothetical protein [unclassified Halorubrum]|uniref:hypothetical protein n=1 Tax=unclassified Halorubrum TaxID=2642239 RepID=UPI000B99068D|nr:MULTISPECIES: hypothetical protein [unclassified Halorubrum]OYR41345.1 hypothetical protein DJ81_12870 [Halorubrum sp. Hd13]OYR52298.1 hypothetical protein DJ74_01670 [Halorubrum sp. Ea8]OYR55970.1 hypothetical protein DJ73_00810 [Halorubrum sp. Ea1]